jgi:hypothetical protein
MNKNIIIAILIVIIIAAVGAFVFSHQQANTTDGKINTQLNFLSQTTLKNGDQVQFELKDAQGALIAGQTVAISYDDGSGDIQKYSINTDQNGKGFLTISGEDAGDYVVTVDYNGSDKYNGCSAKQTITVEDGSSDAEETISENATANTVMYNNGTSSSSSDSSTGSDDTPTSGYGDKAFSNLYYDNELGVYYDDFGTIHGGDMDGNEIGLLREMHEHPNTDEYGNPQ